MNAPLPGLVTRDAAQRAAKTIARLGGAEAARLAERLAAETQGQVLFDTASRGRYATDASIYQVMPLGVFVPRTQDDVATAIDIARDLGAPVLMRGAGTSQCGQTTGAALVIDASKHLRNVLAFDREAMTADVEPGIVLDALNAQLKSERLWFPVDVSTSAQATIGGMAGNNSCGSRSIAYGNMVHNVLGIDAWLSDGSSVSFGPLAGLGAKERAIAEFVRALAIENRAEIAAHWPKVLRRVAGYNLDIFDPQSELPYTRRRQRQPGPSAGRRRRHAGGLPQPEAAAGAAARQQGPRRRQLPDLPRGDGFGPASGQARSRPRSSWSIAR